VHTASFRLASVVEMRYGSGRYLLCQADVVGKLGQAPAARRLAENLLKWADSVPRTPLKPGAAISISDGEERVLDYVGAQVDHLRKGLALANLAPYAYVIADAPALTGSPSEETALRDYVLHGGVLWVRRLTEETKAPVERLTGTRFSIEPSDRPVFLDSSDPTLTGISNFDLYYPPGALADSAVRGEGAILLVKSRESQGGALVKFPVGRGFVLVDQLKWDEEKPPTEAERARATWFRRPDQKRDYERMIVSPEEITSSTFFWPPASYRPARIVSGIINNVGGAM